MKYLKSWVFPLAIICGVSLTSCSEDDDGGTNPTTDTQKIEVTSGQAPDNGQVNIGTVVSDQQGWIVLHRDNGNNAPVVPGIIGKAQVSKGANTDVKIMLDSAVADGEQLWAMLHIDDSQTGVYEFDGVGTADAPAMEDGEIVMIPFTISQTDPMVQASDQSPDNNDVTVSIVNSPENGWIVIHASDANGNFAEVLGQTQVAAGENLNVVVELSDNPANAVDNGDKLWAMLHYDRGTEGTYEFPGDDVPAVFGGAVVMKPFTVEGAAVPSVTVANQTVTDRKVTIAAASVHGPAWVVIHRDNGADGPIVPDIIGRQRLNTGSNTNVMIELNETVMVGDKLWAMLHTDNGVVGTYEFPSGDPPVMAGSAIVMKQFVVQ